MKTLAASVTAGVYRISNFELAQQFGKYLKTEYFYEALNSLSHGDIIYACFDVYGSKEDKELFDKIEFEYGIK